MASPFLSALTDSALKRITSTIFRGVVYAYETSRLPGKVTSAWYGLHPAFKLPFTIMDPEYVLRPK